MLGEIDAAAVPELIVVNKVDAMTEDDVLALRQALPGAVWVSARTGVGIDGLRELIAARLPHPDVDVEVLVPYDRGDLVARVHRDGEVLEERHEESGTRLSARVDGALAATLEEFAVPVGLTGGAAARPDHGQVTGRYGDRVTSGVVRDAGAPEKVPRRLGRAAPPGGSWSSPCVVGALVTADLLTRGWLERMDLRVSDVISGWGLRDSAAFPLVWVVTQLGGRVTILVVLAVLVGYLGVAAADVAAAGAGARRARPADRRSSTRSSTAPAGPRPGSRGLLLPRRRRVLPLRPRRQRRAHVGRRPLAGRGVRPAGARAAGLLVAERGRPGRHRPGDGVAGLPLGHRRGGRAPASGVLLLGVVHALDAVVLSRWVRARAGRQTA